MYFMLYSYNVCLTEKDYCEFNEFLQIKSFYGKKVMTFLRITFAIIIGLGMVVSLFYDGFTDELVANIIADCLLIVFFELLLIPFMKLSIKIYIRIVKKVGKMAFSPSSVMEFYEDYFCETMPENKTEHKYSAIERISIIDGKIIYIHINHAMCYLLPYNVFESQNQYKQFVDFLKAKCDNIDWYRK